MKLIDPDGNDWYNVAVSADAYSNMEKMGDVEYSGGISVSVDGVKVKDFCLQPVKGPSISQVGRSVVGVNDFTLPQTKGDVMLRFSIMYTFSDGTGKLCSRQYIHDLHVGFAQKTKNEK